MLKEAVAALRHCQGCYAIATDKWVFTYNLPLFQWRITAKMGCSCMGMFRLKRHNLCVKYSSMYRIMIWLLNSEAVNCGMVSPLMHKLILWTCSMTADRVIIFPVKKKKEKDLFIWRWSCLRFWIHLVMLSMRNTKCPETLSLEDS